MGAEEFHKEMKMQYPDGQNKSKPIEAFNRASVTYDSDFSKTTLGSFYRSRVHEHLDRIFKPGMLVLDIGCGTGDDAIHLARRGIHVIACDFSPGMLSRADEKIKLAGLTKDIELRELRAENLSRLIEELPLGFDGLYTNFGPLNLIEDLTDFARFTARLLNPGGQALHVVMNLYPIFETVYYLLHGRTQRALARYKGFSRVVVGGTPIKCWFYSPTRFAKFFLPYFTIERIEALGLIIPPPYLSGHFRRRRKFYRRLMPIDKFLSRLPLLNSLGDHFIIELTRNEDICRSFV